MGVLIADLKVNGNVDCRFEDRWECWEQISWLSGSCMMSDFMCYFFQQGPSSTELFGGREPSGESGRLWPSTSNERRHLHGTCGCQISYQVDCSRRSCLQQILHQSRWQAVEFRYKCLYWHYFFQFYCFRPGFIMCVEQQVRGYVHACVCIVGWFMNAYEHIFSGFVTCTYIIIIVVPFFLGGGGCGGIRMSVV